MTSPQRQLSIAMYRPPTELKNADRHCRFYCDRAISCLAAPPLLHQTNHRMNSREATASFLNNILLLSSDTGVYYSLMGQMKDAGLVRFCCLENGEKSQNAAMLPRLPRSVDGDTRIHPLGATWHASTTTPQAAKARTRPTDPRFPVALLL